MDEHKCTQEDKDGVPIKCYGTNPMILAVQEYDPNYQEFWDRDFEVKYCPMCGLPADDNTPKEE